MSFCKGVQTEKFIYIMEFKLNGTAEEALQQINDKRYALPFEAAELPKLLQDGDQILVKASHFMEYGKIVEMLSVEK